MCKRHTGPFRLLDLPPELLLSVIDHIIHIADLHALILVNKTLSQVAMYALYHPYIAPGPSLRFDMGLNDITDDLHASVSRGFHFHGPCCRGESGYNSSTTHTCGTLLHWSARKGLLRPAVYTHKITGVGTGCRDSFGMLPLHRAVQCGNPSVVEYLILADSGAHIDDVAPASNGPMQLGQSPTTAFVIQGLTPVFVAVAYGKAEALRLLLEAGANINVTATTTRRHTDDGKITPLHIATIKGHSDAVQLLLDYGVDSEGSGEQVWKYTPLHMAAMGGHVEIVKLLLSKGVNVEAEAPTGHRPLYMAVEGGFAEIVELLLNAGANPLIGGTYNFRKFYSPAESTVTLLQLAAIKGLTEVIWILVKNANMDVNTASKYLVTNKLFLNEATPLHLASQFGKPDCVKLLVELGADLEARDILGRTPICYGALGNAVECVATLIKLGANTRNKTTYQWLAVELATGNGWCYGYGYNGWDIGGDRDGRKELMKLLWDKVPRMRTKDWWENEIAVGTYKDGISRCGSERGMVESAIEAGRGNGFGGYGIAAPRPGSHLGIVV